MCNLSEAIWERSIKEGLQEGLQQGLEQGMLQTLVSLVQKGMLTIEAAAQEANMEMETFEQYMEHIKDK